MSLRLPFRLPFTNNAFAIFALHTKVQISLDFISDSFHSCRLFPAPVAPIHLIQSHFPMRIGALYNMHPICVSKVQSSGNRTWKTIDGGGLEQEERLWLPEKHGKIPILSRCHLRLSRSHDNVKWVDVDVNEDAAGDADVDVEGPT